MCSRYEFRSPPENIIERFGLLPSALDAIEANGAAEIRPTDPALVIGNDQTAEIVKWGLDVPWQKPPVINARAETAENKSTFVPLLNRRVLVPASAYFEWRHSGTEKIKTRIGIEDEPSLAMAGLRSGDRFTILTCSPSPSISHIHNRMPVLVDRAGAADWLNPDYNFANLKELLRPYTGRFDVMEVPTGKPRQTDLFD